MVIYEHFVLWELHDAAMGATRCRDGRRQKEADMALLPRNRNQSEDWPSMVIEVGMVETISDLRSDAHYWMCGDIDIYRCCSEDDDDGEVGRYATHLSKPCG